MADLTGMMQAAAGAKGGIEGGIFIAFGNNDLTLTMLNHNEGSVSLASTYTSMPSGTRYVAFSPDSKFLATAHSGTAPGQNFTLFNNDTGTLVRSSSIDLPSSGASCAWHPSGDFIAVGNFSTSPQLRILNHSSGSVSLASTYAYGEHVTGVSFSSSGDHMMAVSSGTVTQRLFSFSAGTLTSVATYNTSSGCNMVEFSPDGTRIALAPTSGPIVLLNHSSGSISLASTYNQGPPVLDLSWSSDGAFLAAALETTGIRAITLLNHSAGTLSFASSYLTADSGNNTGKSVSFHPSGEYLAVGNDGSASFTLLNHSAGTLSLATTYNIGRKINRLRFNPES